jgi:acetyltransferase-like isoleucine patch superfamily enzyme
VILGRNTALDEGSIVRAYGGIIKIGNNCCINPYCVLISGSQGLIIGDDVLIAAHSTIVAGNHAFKDSSKRIYEQGSDSKGIVIDDDVWLGAGTKILDGVHIRTGSVIGAGAVVTKSTVPYGVYVGVPATIISSRHPLG